MRKSEVVDSGSSSKRTRQIYKFNRECQVIVGNIYEALNEEKRDPRHAISKEKVWERLNFYTNISVGSLGSLLNGEELPSGSIVERARLPQMPLEDEMKIRPAFLVMRKEKKLITLNTLLAQLRNSEKDWEWGRTSLYHALHRIGFTFDSKRKGYYDRMRESPENILRRALYLGFLYKYIGEKRPLFFMDESWCNKNDNPKKVWHDRTLETVDAVPPGKGARWIMLGAIGEKGWVPHSFRMWKGNVKSEDYHTEMNEEIFKNWNFTYLWPNIPSNAVCIYDRAPYHTGLTSASKKPPASANREDLVEWIVSHQISDGSGNMYTSKMLLDDPFTYQAPHGTRTQQGYTKNALLLICEKHMENVKPQYNSWEWACQFNEKNNTDIKVLYLPVAHPQLNPIEMVWNRIKTHVRQHNGEKSATADPFTMNRVQELVREKVADVGEDLCSKFFDHSMKFARLCWDTDEAVYDEHMEEREAAQAEIDDDDEDVDE
jgi:transposase